MNLHLYDTKSRSLQPLKPVHEGEVGIYLCGATVQGSPHIGHLRSAVAFDTLIRWLKKNGMKVTYIPVSYTHLQTTRREWLSRMPYAA